MGHVKPEVREGIVGPGVAFNAAFKGEAEIVATVICGDTYYNENLESAKKEILDMIKQYNPDVFIAGPAFNAGRYGVACGDIATAVQNELNIPALTGMYVENPGADMYKEKVYMVATKNSAVGMRAAVKVMAPLALKLAKGEAIGASIEEGYMPNGVRKNFFDKERGSKRAVDRVAPNKAIKDLSKAKIALVTSGGIVPKGNPDHIESSSASKFGKYSLEGFEKLSSSDHQTAHGGYDPVYANDDPNRVLPVDVMREFEKEGVIGELHKYYYATVGNGTSVANAKKYASTFAKELVADGVDAVILTST